VLETVTLPMWAVVVAGVLAMVAVLDRALLPSLRWANRVRRERAIDQLNTRLRLRLRPFKLARRSHLVGQLMLDPEILQTIEAEAARTGVSVTRTTALARGYAREIVPAFSATAYFKIGIRLARTVSRSLYRILVGAADETALSGVDPDATVVFVINHRSNMDYVLVTYLAGRSSALSYAVGEWARIIGLQSLIRAMGAYFIRRDSNNPLYRKVLARYVNFATRSGVTQAVFPEGGLTRDGVLQGPKLGLLSYMVSDFDPAGPRDIVFVPVGLNYDRVLEDRVQIAAAATAVGTRPRFKFNLWVFFRFLLRNTWQKLTGRWQSFGYAAVSFGNPVSLRRHVANRGIDFRTLREPQRGAEIARLGGRLMAEVGRVVPALPVSLVAHVLLADDGTGLSTLEVKGRVFSLMERIRGAGGQVPIPRLEQEAAVEAGLGALRLRRLADSRGGLHHANPRERHLLGYYANSIGHLLDAPPWPVIASPGSPSPVSDRGVTAPG